MSDITLVAPSPRKGEARPREQVACAALDTEALARLSEALVVESGRP